MFYSITGGTLSTFDFSQVENGVYAKITGVGEYSYDKFKYTPYKFTVSGGSVVSGVDYKGEDLSSESKLKTAINVGISSISSSKRVFLIILKCEE